MAQKDAEKIFPTCDLVGHFRNRRVMLWKNVSASSWMRTKMLWKWHVLVDAVLAVKCSVI